MMRLFVLFFILVLAISTQAQYDFRSLPHKTDFGTRFHGNTSFSNGTYAAIGIVEDGINKTSDMVLVKWNCLGEIEWTKTLGASIGVNNTNGSITEAQNGDLVLTYSLATSWFNANMLVARFTQDGALVWAKVIGLGAEYGRGITATRDGGFVAVGGTDNFGVDRDRSDIYVVKLDGNGNVLWARSYGNEDAIDDAYHVIESSKGELIISGRFIVDGTFYNFLMRADADGNPLAFKGYGGPNHRNFGYATLETPEGDFINTGYTTLAKENFMSNGDCYLMKVDEDLNQIWAKIYEPQEADRNDFGFSLVLEEDGDYGICLESSSYRAISGPQAPNKNVIFSTDTDGNLKRVMLLNPKGSQYTKMSKANDGGYFITGFSTYYISSTTAPFNGFGFKTDPDYASGDNCEEYDRTNQTITSEFPWDVQDIVWKEQSNFRDRDYTVAEDFSFDSSQIICSRVPEVDVQMLPIPDTICIGENIELFANPQGGLDEFIWDMGNDSIIMEQSANYVYDSAGNYTIILVATDGCQTLMDTQSIVVNQGEVFDISRQLCPGDFFTFMGDTITDAGEYMFSNGDGCDTTFKLEVTLAILDTIAQTFEICNGESVTVSGQVLDSLGTYTIVAAGTGAFCDTIKIVELTEKIDQADCQCEGFFPNAFTPNGMENKTFGMTEIMGGCSPLNVSDFKMRIYSSWGDLVFDSNDVNDRWDGTINGKDAMGDVYLVTCSYTIEGKQMIHNGDITLVR